ncbi:glutamate receptor ionotropic, kainate 2-like isoform X3 [Mercenaria mercenaria]|uniref:glutamate receptor ionotropic, kainate 2-like isoform X3 n=1 Tax=Mercenaria mercenaria TaxID=6596 RepID=UPI00234E6D89|nr:glutamate receptor ionotropic, kainate 2-like isoform X3 [Mercenaria mercenaria]
MENMDFIFKICISFVAIWNLHLSYGQTEHFRVAALFEPEYEGMILAFQNAVTKVNMHSEVGPGKNIIYDLKTIAPHDSFVANKEVCREMRAPGGIAAVFGPVSEISRAHVQSLCNAFEIPHIQAVWDSRVPREYFSISVYPDHEVLGRSFADLIKHWEWKSFTVIYEDGESLVRLQKLLETARGEEYKMTIRMLEVHQNTFTSMLKELKEKQEYRIVIDCHVSKIRQILDEADSLNMLSAYYHFHFTSLDLSQLDLEDFKFKGANITSMRLIDPSNPEVMNIMAEWGLMETNIGRSPLLGMRAIGTETALMYDAVHMYARALAGLANAHHISTETLNCNKREVWNQGNSLLNYMKAIEYDGLSGKIRFDDGKRKDFRLGIISLTHHGLIEIGHWTPKIGINITVTVAQQVQDEREMLRNMTLRVVTIYDPPYVVNLTEPNEHGRMHEGFIIDLLDELSRILGFNYTIYEESKREYGSKVEATGKWNGMIGDLIERDRVNKADIAAAGLTITYARAKVVDFTMPFLNLGITIIYRKPMKSPPDLFSFLLPLSPDVWIYMIAAYLCVSFMLFVIARFTPYEWENPHPCNEESEEVENQFTILNSLWFTIGSLMQQGSDVAPKASSTRFVASIWYLFTLILVSSYTANLAAFLTKSRMVGPITNAEDLSLQTDIKYGTLASGSTRDFFKNSNMSTYKRMNAYMNANGDRVLVKGNTEGFEKVKSENYAFLAESTSIDYQVQRNCDLMQVGDLLDSKGYGLAGPKDSPWIALLSKEIVHLQQKQVISKFYTKWWVEKSGAVCEDDTDKKKNTNALGVANVGGVFVVLAGGTIFALLVAILEFLWKVSRNARVDKQTFWSEMTEELRFIFVKCKSTRNTGGDQGTKTVENNGVTFNAIPTVPNDRNHKEVFD